MTARKKSKKELIELLENVATLTYKNSIKSYNIEKNQLNSSFSHEKKMAKLIQIQTKLIKHINDPAIVLDVLKQVPIQFNAPTYHFSSEKLFEMKEYLVVKDGKEKFCHATGIKITPNNIVLTSLIKPGISKRTYTYAEGDNTSLSQHLAYLTKFGHAVFLQAHRHPGKGQNATYPSGTDIQNHRIWEVCYPLIGAIFVEDGYFRFFSAGRNFNIEIHGKGVKKIDRTIYKFDY